MSWREPRPHELEQCLKLQPLALGDGIIGRDKALLVWRGLLGHPAFVARLIESGPSEQRTIVGFGASVFVAPRFLAAEVATPRPGLASRIVASLASGSRALLPFDEIARANAGDGLDAVFLSFVWWPTSTPPQLAEMLMASLGSCVEAHAGYRLRAAIVECPREIVRAVGGNSGDFEVIAEFPQADTVLLRLNRQGMSAVAGSMANLLFQYREPILELAPSQQRLLAAALDGAVDRKLADDLGLTLASVKKSWRVAFERIEDRMPGLFADVESGNETRGSQKRHLVLHYLRQHPEELRPYRKD